MIAIARFKEHMAAASVHNHVSVTPTTSMTEAQSSKTASGADCGTVPSRK